MWIFVIYLLYIQVYDRRNTRFSNVKNEGSFTNNAGANLENNGSISVACTGSIINSGAWNNTTGSAVSKSAHATTLKGKYVNPSGVILTSSKIALSVGKSKTLKPKMKLSKKTQIHIATFRYESTNTKVATVSEDGKIKAKKKGTTTIYVFMQNGIYKKVTVTVK